MSKGTLTTRLRELMCARHATDAECREFDCDARANAASLLIANAPTIIRLLEAVDGAEKALEETRLNLELVERVPVKDPDYGAEVAALGDRIGYGALMTSASASWHAKLKQDGWPTGGAFVAGPCHGTALKNLEMVCEALATLRAAREVKP